MYKDFFGLREDPFSVSPDPRFLFHTVETDEALACLRYGVEGRKGFVLVTGEVGTGKTTLLNAFLEWLRGRGAATAFIFNPRLDVCEFLDFMIADLGVACESRLKSQVLLRLNQWLLDRYRAKEPAVVVVDEAQNLSMELLEEIRLLTNLETFGEKLLQIVLSGQPELEQKLARPELRQLLQRITLRCRTLPLSDKQTQGYIHERLRIAGADGEPIFTPEALVAVYRYARGIPRAINMLCEHALISAYADGRKPIRASFIEDAAREFDLRLCEPSESPSLDRQKEAVRCLQGAYEQNPRCFKKS